MKKYIYSSIAFVLLFTSYSCDNFFETTIKIDPPPYQQQLVLHAYLSNVDTSITAMVTENIGLLELRDTLAYINDAVIEVLIDGVVKYRLDYLENKEGRLVNYESLRLDPNDIEGKEVEFRISHPDYIAISAKQRMPNLVPLKRVRYLENAGISDDGEVSSGVELELDDPPNEANYYEVSLYYEDTENGRDIFSIYTTENDISVEESILYNSHLLSDENFDGQNFKFRLFTNGFDPNDFDPSTLGGRFLCSWRMLTEEQYLYSRSVRQQENTEDLGPFAQPVTIFSNVENGLGVFGLRREVTYPVEF